MITPYEIILVYVDSFMCTISSSFVDFTHTIATLILWWAHDHCHHSWFPCSFRGCLYHLPPLTCLQWWTPFTPLICFKIATLLASESSYMHAGTVLPWVFWLLLLQTTHMHACLPDHISQHCESKSLCLLGILSGWVPGGGGCWDRSLKEDGKQNKDVSNHPRCA